MSEDKAPWERFGPEITSAPTKEESEKAPWERLPPEQEYDLDRRIAGVTGAGIGAGISAARGLGSGAMLGAQKLGEAFRGQQPPAATGTSGEKWLGNWAGIKKEGVGGVPEAAQIYERQKPHGKVTSKIYKQFGNQPLDIARMLAAQQPAKLEDTTSMFTKLMQNPIVQKFGRYGAPPLAMYSSFVDMQDIMAEQEKEKADRLKQALAAISGISGLAALYPPLTIPAGAVSLGATGIQKLREGIQESRARPAVPSPEVSYEDIPYLAP